MFHAFLNMTIKIVEVKELIFVDSANPLREG